jgi:hypothetical protein
MGMNRDKFRGIVGGITTPKPEAPPAADTAAPAAEDPNAEPVPPPAGQGSAPAGENDPADEAKTGESRRFAKRGRPKGRKAEPPAAKGRKVKVSLFLSEVLVNDLYDWAHADKIHPGEMFERALKPFHERESKKRNGGKE